MVIYSQYEGVVTELSEPELPICGIGKDVNQIPVRPGIQFDLRKLQGKHVKVTIEIVEERSKIKYICEDCGRRFYHKKKQCYKCESTNIKKIKKEEKQ